MTIKKDLKWLNIRSFGLDWHTDRHMIRISKIFKANPGWNIASDWKTVDFWTMIWVILMVGRIWASLILIISWSGAWCDSYKILNFGVIFSLVILIKRILKKNKPCIKIGNLVWCKCQKHPLEVFREKRCSLKCRKLKRKLLYQRKHLWILQNF